MKFELTKVPGAVQAGSGDQIEELQSLLGALSPDEPFQLWISKGDGESMCVLANAQYAYVSMLLPDDDCLVVVNPEKPEASGLTPIYLENGQLDEMEIRRCVPRAVGLEVGLDYFRTGRPSRHLTWISG